MHVYFTLTDAEGRETHNVPFDQLDHDEMEDVALQLAEFEDRWGGIVLTLPYDQVQGVTMHVSQLSYQEMQDIETGD